jgi:hypothetical protein
MPEQCRAAFGPNLAGAAWPNSHYGLASPCRGARRERVLETVTVPRAAAAARQPSVSRWPRWRDFSGVSMRRDGECIGQHHGVWGSPQWRGDEGGRCGVSRQRQEGSGDRQRQRRVPVASRSGGG